MKYQIITLKFNEECIICAAIDPMDLYFGGTDPVVRLDTSDAKFVEVIHSNAATFTNMGLGIPGAIGHVDHYPVIIVFVKYNCKIRYPVTVFSSSFMNFLLF